MFDVVLDPIVCLGLLKDILVNNNTYTVNLPVVQVISFLLNEYLSYCVTFRKDKIPVNESMVFSMEWNKERKRLILSAMIQETTPWTSNTCLECKNVKTSEFLKSLFKFEFLGWNQPKWFSWVCVLFLPWTCPPKLGETFQWYFHITLKHHTTYDNQNFRI